jgi:methionyl-tRNA formyltransferase
MLDVLDQYAEDRLHPQKQDESKVTRATKFTKVFGYLDLAQPATRVANTINGLSPWPGVSAKLGPNTLRLLRAAVDTHAGHPGPVASPTPGAILDHANGTIQCGGGSAIRLLEVQPAGRRVLTWRDFANGYQQDTSDRLRPIQPM